MEKESEINKSIGNRILIFRKSNGINRTKLAKILNITQQQLDKYEKGINRICAAKLAIITEKFDIDISYFYSDIIQNIKDKTNNLQKEQIDTIISYYLNIKSEERKKLILELVKEMAN